MLKLTNLKIKYGDYIVIHSGEIELKPGDLCLVSGDSGTGKSSLLDILAVQGKGNHEFDYFWKNEDVLAFDEERKSEFLLNDLACVTQNNLIFGELTVDENLNAFCEIGFGKIEKSRIENLVNKLGLRRLLDKKAKKLSGGEKQRVAIACAILKNASIYLFDEPTSMIDIDRKEVVFQILNELASLGKIIVVVSHELSKELFNKVYIIKDKQLKLERNMDNDVIMGSLLSDKKAKIDNIISNLSKKFFFSQPIANSLYVMVIGICLGLIINIIGGAVFSVNEQKALAEVVKSPELIVVNAQDWVFTESSDDGNYPISDEDYEAIQAIEGVESARRFVYFPLDASIKEYLDNDYNEYMIRTDEYEIILKKDGKEISSFNYSQEFEGSSYAIYPTYSHQHIEEQCISSTEEEGIYITKRIADKLGVNEVNGEVINLYFSVPIGNNPGYFWGYLMGHDEDVTVKRRYMYKVLVNMDLPIKGIINDIDYYSYNHSYNADFFLDIDTIEAIQYEKFKKYEDVLYTLSITKNDDIDKQHREFYETKIIDSGIWNSDALIIHLDENENINHVISEITKINPALSIAVKSYGMSGVDTKMTSNVVMTAVGYSMIIIVVVLISIAIIKGYRRKSRKEDYELLKKNGFDYLSILKLEKKENHLEIILIFGISMLATIGIYLFLTKMVYLNISISLWMIFVLIAIDAISIFLGNYISKIIVKNSDSIQNRL